jgi:hypothetical protein
LPEPDFVVQAAADADADPIAPSMRAAVKQAIIHLLRDFLFTSCPFFVAGRRSSQRAKTRRVFGDAKATVGGVDAPRQDVIDGSLDADV